MLAIDLCTASLAYALRETNELGLANLHTGVADILAFDAAGRTFPHAGRVRRRLACAGNAGFPFAGRCGIFVYNRLSRRTPAPPQKLCRNQESGTLRLPSIENSDAAFISLRVRFARPAQGAAGAGAGGAPRRGRAGLRARPGRGAGAGDDPPGVAGGGARLLGPAAASGAARYRAHERHPFHDRGRLSAVQFRRAGRQSRRLQCRSRPHDLRGAQGQLHGADASLRYLVRRPQRKSRRCRHRLHRGVGADAQARRFHRSLLPSLGALRRPCRQRDPRGDAGTAGRQEDRGGRGLLP